METNKIFSKLNIKDYNNELEEILEKKPFSSDVKNLLLSMLYKIETAYKDYATVKREVLEKKDFISYLLTIIKEKCLEIEFINLDSKELPQVNQEKGKIICYPNEKSLLSAIWYMGENDVSICVEYEYLKEAIQEMLYKGNNISQVEVIRDFNGWSWDIVIKEIENMGYNIVYQSLLLLNGNKIINASILNKEELQIENKENYYFLELLYELVMNLYIRKNKDAKTKMTEIKQEKAKQLELFNDKKKFIQTITNQKKECTDKIEKIDRMLNDKELLKREYDERNEKLPNKEKIFSISHLTTRIEQERKELLEQIKKYNRMIEPKEFVKERDKIEKEVDWLNKIDITAKSNIQQVMINYCKEFLKIALKRIEKIEDKMECINWIYKIRYYRYIPLNENKCVKDIKKLEKEFEKIIKQLIKQAQKYKVWDIFSEDETITYKIIKPLFDSKMINFENVNIICKYEKGILSVEYYDTNILEMKKEFEIENVRIKKKIKLFM